MKKLILASASPRRSDLLKQIGLDFEVIPSSYQEDNFLKLKPEALTREFAKSKAQEVASSSNCGLVIGADTAVILDDKILGKPESIEEAFEMLKKLSGRMHQVITGLAVVNSENGAAETTHSTTKVWFRELTDKEISSYIKTGEPMDKAGAYGIQGCGALFVEKIEGCYFNVVGLPLAELGRILSGLGYEVL
ncbi:MAG: septum formation inhibitor Maf [Firmicutes bacterium HGW-Firmicutes-13]|nr:MAG: septum formation inhibitor Maf [Firmicutes bacterium HGW-Firmicutes-13]